MKRMDFLFGMSAALALIALTMASRANAEVPLRGFGQFSYVNSNTDTDGANKASQNAFSNGGLDLFLSTNISKKVMFLAEVAFEMNSKNETATDIERFTAQYIASPWLKIGAGRFHTALGYWNDNYHHGSWLHATADRPLFYHFEDDNGILPTHSEGLEIRGEGDLGPGQLGYIFNIANGRGGKIDPPQIVNDQDQSKATNLLLYYTLPDYGNLRFGGLYYTDNLPGCTYDSTITNPTLIDTCSYSGANPTAMRTKGKEKIYGFHLAWAPGALETLVEYFTLDHSYENTNEEAAKVTGGYAQLAYKLGDWTPYYRYDLITVPEDKLDAYTLQEGSTTGQTAGVRWDIEPTSAIKFEMFMLEKKHKRDTMNAVNTTIDHQSDAKINWSFTF